jgi:hypothetical protein
MDKAISAWRLFFKALEKQPEKNREEWLRLWLFGTDGATLRPEAGAWKEIAALDRDEQQRAICSLVSAARPKNSN